VLGRPGSSKHELAVSPFNPSLPLDVFALPVPGARMLDRSTLLAIVSRITRKWRRNRQKVFDLVPRDTIHDHERGQGHVFWKARVSAGHEFSEIYDEVRNWSVVKQQEYASAYLHRRVRKASQDVKDHGNDLQLAQARGLLSFLRTFTPTVQQLPLLALPELLLRRRTPRTEREVVSAHWEGGTPHPVRVVTTRAVSRKWEGARRPRQQLPALNDDAPLPSTECMRLDGRLELPSGARPQKFVIPDGIGWSYLREERPDLLSLFGPSAASVHGCWETTKPILREYSQPNLGCATGADLRRALAVGWKSLKLSRLPQPSLRALDCVKVNPDAYPGVMSSRIGSNRQKVFAVCSEIAKGHYTDQKKGFTPDTSYWSCGGRAKPVMDAKPGDPFKSRLILMPETPSTILESAFSQPFTAMVSRCGGDIMIGCEMTNRKYERMTIPLSKYSHCKAYDWSGFDSRVREDQIVTAFAIVRACFYGDDEWLDNVFLRFISHFLVKRIIIPGGWTYTLTKGVPSGSPFTSIIDSLVNWLVITDLEVTVGGPKAPGENRRFVYGDDFVQGFARNPPPADDYVRLAFNRWGFVAKNSAIHEGPFMTTSCDTSLPFLSFRFPNGHPARPVRDALIIGLLPKGKPRNTYFGQFSRCMYLDHFAPYDFDTLKYHREYFWWVSKKIKGFSITRDGRFVDWVSQYIHKAMANYVADGYSEGIASLGEWFRQVDARRLPERWCPRTAARGLPGERRAKGKLQTVLACLRYGNLNKRFTHHKAIK